MASDNERVALVVDDDPACRTLMEVLLKRVGFEVDHAEDGEVALQKLRGGRYSVLLLDLLMPRVNGFDLLRELNLINPAMLQRTIVLTAATDRTTALFDDSRVFAFLRKPFDIQRLVSTVEACAGGPPTPWTVTRSNEPRSYPFAGKDIAPPHFGR